jgi:hypothetical protein
MSESRFVILKMPGEAEASAAEEQLAEEYPGLRCLQDLPSGANPRNIRMDRG